MLFPCSHTVVLSAFIERPEEAIDNRTLYEKLKTQKDQKQGEFEEQFKFSESQYYLQHNNVSQLNCGTL